MILCLLLTQVTPDSVDDAPTNHAEELISLVRDGGDQNMIRSKLRLSRVERVKDFSVEFDLEKWPILRQPKYVSTLINTFNALCVM